MANNGECSTSRQPRWTKLETAVLIQSWGNRYLELNRVPLQFTDWQEVANAVNSVQYRIWTPDQCMTHVDTLRSRFEYERRRIRRSDGVLTSSWKLYPELEHLFGPANADAPAALTTPSVGKAKKRKVSGGVESVAEAIKRWGEAFERVETMKAEASLELEKQRMAFAVELEKERMQMAVDMFKMHRAKRVKKSNEKENEVTLEEFLRQRHGASD